MGWADTIFVCFKVCSRILSIEYLTKHWGNGSKQVTLGSGGVWVQEKREGVVLLVDGWVVRTWTAENRKDRSPMASRTSCQSQVSKLQRDTEVGKWSVIRIINVISLSTLQRQTSVRHPGRCWPASTLHVTAWDPQRWQRRVVLSATIPKCWGVNG